MAIPILFELNQELTRLFVAGSRLSADDPRLKKFIAPLKKYGEKATVFLKLAERLEELLNVDANQSAQKLIETETYLLSVLSTQGDSSPNPSDNIIDINYELNKESITETNTGYRILSPVINALTTTGSGRMEVVQQAFENGVFKDPRIYKPAVDALGDKYSEIADYMANTVLPSMGESICGFLLDGYNVKGGVIDGRRLTVIHKIRGERMLDLVDEATEEGSAPVKTEAVKIMAEYPRYEEILLGMLGESKSVREEVMKALVEIDSKTGIDKLIETYKSAKADTVIDAITYGISGYLADELLKVAYSDYEAVKKSADVFYNASESADETAALQIQRLKNDINALRNKRTDEAAKFFQTMLCEEWLVKAESILPKDKKQGYYYKTLEDGALEALHYSGKGNDFIWEMFTDTQEGLLSKIFKAKKSKKKDIPKMLCCYAFHIGARKLDAEEFYNVFFKTNLYKDIAKYDYYAFDNVFLKGEDCPKFSKKVARYFVENMDHYNINLAARIVSSDDTETLNLLAERLKANLEKNTYGSVNYEILKRLGETGHKSFKEMYELYCTKGHGNALDRSNLEQFLNK